MEYQEVTPISRQEALSAFKSSNPNTIADALIRLSFYESDRRWVQEKCILFAQHENLVVRRAAVICIGHLARIHKRVDLEVVLPILEQLEADPSLNGAVEDAYDDINMFCKE